MIISHFQQRRPAGFRQFLGICKRNHVIGAAMQDDGVGPDPSCRSPILPCRTEQQELGIATFDVHGNGAAAARSDDNCGLVLVELGLGGRNSSAKIIVIQYRIDDFMSVVLEVARLDATGNRMPAVEEKDFHSVSLSLVASDGTSPQIVLSIFFASFAESDLP